MKRREFISAAVFAAASPVVAQTNSVGQISIFGGTTTPPNLTPEQRKREYAICKVRGHQVGGYPNTVNAIYPPPVMHPWCKFCGTTFWEVVTTIVEESGAPE